MNRRLASALLLAVASLLAPRLALPAFDPVNDDTDIFLANPTFNATRPNVLIFLDNTSNWSQKSGGGVSKYQGVRAALAASLTNIVTDAYNVGLAMFVQTGAPNTGNEGAYIRYGIRQMSGAYNDENSNKGKLIKLVNQLQEGAAANDGDKATNARVSLAFAEMFKYYAGQTTHSGHGKEKVDAGDRVHVGAGREAHFGSPLPNSVLPAPIGGSAGAATYVSPIVDPCQKNFIVFISNGEAAENSSSLKDAQDMLAAIVGKNPPDTIPISPLGEQGVWSDEYAKFMANGDCNIAVPGVQNVITYTIDVLPKSVGQGPDHTALLQSMATNGKGKYFAVTDIDSTSQLEMAFQTIFQEVQAVNSVFASTTLPVSVNVRGTNLNQVYIGVFRPDQSKAPRWLGNLKMYKLGVSSATQSLFLADANVGVCPPHGCPAENASTGFIGSTALSYWTTSSDFWKFRTNEENGVGLNSDMPDGDLVEKGGVAQQIRIDYPTDQATRKVYTCTGAGAGGRCLNGAALSATPFNATNASAGDLGAFRKYTVTSLTWDSITKLATATLADPVFDAAFNPQWADVEPGLSKVRIEGATPTVFNGDWPITRVPLTNNQFTYVLDPGPDSTRARVTTDVDHLLGPGDYVYVDSYDEFGCVNGFATWTYDCVFGFSGSTYVKPITRISATQFDYTLSDPESAPAIPGRFWVYGLKQTASVLGIQNENQVYVNIPGHGYPGTTGTAVAPWGYLWDERFTWEWYSTQQAVLIEDTDTLKATSTWFLWYGLGHGQVPASYFWNGATPPVVNTAVATAAGWTGGGWTGGGRKLNLYNASGYVGTQTVTAMGALTGPLANRFTFPSSVDAGIVMNANMRVGYTISKIERISNRQAVVTVTLPAGETTHGLVAGAGSRVNIFNTGGTFIPGGCTAPAPCPGYDASWVIQQVTATTFLIEDPTMNRVSAPNPLTVPPVPGQSMIAGFTVSDIQPAYRNTVSMNATPIFFWRFFYPGYGPTALSISPLGNATGIMTAGRTADSDPALQASIVAWTRGQDNKLNENRDCTLSPFYPCTPTNPTPRMIDIRASIHGDVLHSRPATVNYSRFPVDFSQPANDNDVYAFYGSNDGMLRAIKGGIASDEGSISPGEERWSFIPKEFFPKLNRLRENSPAVSSVTPKDYFFDGSIGVYQKDATPPPDPVTGLPTGRAGTIGDHPDDRVYLYVALRRGGNFIYGLDVTTPHDPKLLWRRGAGDAGGGWNEVGLTWSEPRVARVRLSPADAIPGNPDGVVLIFGAGYDEDPEDVNPCLVQESHSTRIVRKAIGSGTITYTSTGTCVVNNPTPGSEKTFPRTKGRGLLIVDAFTGNVLWQVGLTPAGATHNLAHPDMTCAIPSDVTVLDRNRDGFADRIYVGDTCGNVWRAEIGQADPRDWRVTKIAALSSTTVTDIVGKRKFLFPPDLVLSKDNVATPSPVFFSVLIGSGDREHPFDANVQNSFYMVKDRDASTSDPLQLGVENKTTRWIGGSAASPLCTPCQSNPLGPDPFTAATLFDATNVAGVNDFGWKIDLAAGEKAVGSAVTIAGTTFFNTNQPSATAGGGACGSNLGVARQYLVSYTDAAATTDLNALGTLSIANRSTIHAGGGYLPSPVPVVVEIDGKKYQAVISGTSVATPPGLTLDARVRTYWYKEVDQ